MYGGKQTLYDILSVSRDAKQSDIVRAWRRIHSEMRQETVAPDPRRAALVHEAYEVLSDPHRRAAYDASLRGATFLGVHGGDRPARRWGLILAALALVAGAAWYLAREDAPEGSAGPARNVQEVQAAAAVAIGRLDRVELSGERHALGAAVAIEEGVMMAPCSGIAPDAVLLVRVPPRDIPARLRQADASTGLCKLVVSGGASWPLAMSDRAPQAGDAVYAVGFDARGEVVLKPARVKAVRSDGLGRVIEPSARHAGSAEGSPLLDQDGRLLGVLLQGRYSTLPAGLVAAKRHRPAPAPEAPAPAEPEVAPADIDPRLRDVPPEKVERLQKAFRPPPQVPDDL